MNIKCATNHHSALQFNQNYNKMQLSFQQRSQLAQTVWWSPTPTHLLRVCPVENTLLIFCTDLKDVWICRKDRKTLADEKQIFNSALQVKQEQLLNLLVKTLASFDQRAKYKLTPITSGDLVFNLKVPLSIYNFTWEFGLKLLPGFDTRRMIMRDIITPLTSSLLAQEARCSAIESRIPASDRLDTEKDWAVLAKGCRAKGFNELGQSSRYFLGRAGEVAEKEPVDRDKIVLSSTSGLKNIKKPEVATTLDQSYQNEQLLRSTLDQKQLRQKTKKKKVDFI